MVFNEKSKWTAIKLTQFVRNFARLICKQLQILLITPDELYTI